ncbi:tetratricopeptide repeat protein [Anaerobacillus sp. MEB173]|uniref:tetratricopeptide repeat protein n=1 Tax=Anaerobacillus sp. MEB173 TaxID=3383345 RepID=UPI003F8DA101
MTTTTLNQAIQYVENGDVDKGLSLIESIEATADHETKYTIAELYYNWGLVDKAKTIIDELIMLYPDEGELYVFSAELLIDLDEEDEAIEMLLEIKSNDREYLRAQLLLADLYQLQGLDEVAEQKLQLAKHHAPEEPIISFGLGEFYLDRGDFLKSIPYYKQALSKREQLPDCNIELRLAEAYSASGQFEDAITYYEQGLEDQVDVSSLFGYGYTAYQLEQHKVAIEQFQRLKGIDPDYSSLYPYLAKAYEAEHLFDKALQTLEDGMKIDDYNEALLLAAAKLSLKMKDPEKAEDYLRRLLALNPSHFEGIQTLSALLKHEERYSELIDLIEHCQQYGEEDPLFDWYLANAKYEEDQLDEASTLYKKAYSHFQEDVEFLEEYSYVLLEIGNRKEAVEMLKKAYKLDPARIDIEERIIDLDSAFNE